MRIRPGWTFGVAAAVAVAAFGCGGGGGTDPDPTSTTGSIAGRVAADGSGVSGAEITLSGAANRTTSTGSNGNYSFANLTPGAYTASVTLPGGFELAAGQNLSRPVTVAAGAMTTVDWNAVRLSTGPVDTVLFSGTTFNPEILTIDVGGTVVWINQGGSHTITPEGHSEWNDVASSSTGEALRVTFDTAGEFDYFCQPHLSAGMTGTIQVQP